ncbi:MAG TPA: YihY/virulence factor BrkB family protein [Solirubrobacteraceae bacterium]|jgi:inner membrane protein YhjD|nr:YihY/virulence factor BrkB family protein [Solirubrobacteraceae bacterium]
MDPLAPIRAFDRFQQRHPALAIPLAVIKKFGNDSAGNLAALVAYYAFFSIFPLLLVFVTVLGYVLQHNPATLHSIEQSVSANFPAVSKVLDFSALHGHILGLIIGLVGAFWSGLGVTSAAQTALDTVWAVPQKSRPNFVQSKLRGIGLLIAVGLMFIIATGASGLVSGGLGGVGTKIAGIVVSLIANCALYLTSFRLMTASEVPTKKLLIGVAVAAVLWTILQAIGGLYLSHVTKHMSPAYATIGTVIALLIWLHLGAQITLYAAELNVVLERGLWPRSLIGLPRLSADLETYEALAKIEERDATEHVDVSFDERAANPHPKTDRGLD